MNKSMRNLLTVLKALAGNTYKLYEDFKKSDSIFSEKYFQEFVSLTSIIDLIEDKKHFEEMASIFKVVLE